MAGVGLFIRCSFFLPCLVCLSAVSCDFLCRSCYSPASFRYFVYCIVICHSGAAQAGHDANRSHLPDANRSHLPEARDNHTAPFGAVPLVQTHDDNRCVSAGDVVVVTVVVVVLFAVVTVALCRQLWWICGGLIGVVVSLSGVAFFVG